MPEIYGHTRKTHIKCRKFDFIIACMTGGNCAILALESIPAIEIPSKYYPLLTIRTHNPILLLTSKYLPITPESATMKTKLNHTSG